MRILKFSSGRWGAVGAGAGGVGAHFLFLIPVLFKKAADSSGNLWDVVFLCFKRQTQIICQLIPPSYPTNGH